MTKKFILREIAYFLYYLTPFCLETFYLLEFDDCLKIFLFKIYLSLENMSTWSSVPMFQCYCVHDKNHKVAEQLNAMFKNKLLNIMDLL